VQLTAYRAQPAGLADDQLLCYGVEAAVGHAGLSFEYRETNDPTDPAFYSTCYVMKSSFVWLPVGDTTPEEPKWKFGKKCLDCNNYMYGQRAMNLSHMETTKWQVAGECQDCDRVVGTKAALAYSMDTTSVNDALGDPTSINYVPEDGDDDGSLPEDGDDDGSSLNTKGQGTKKTEKWYEDTDQLFLIVGCALGAMLFLFVAGLMYKKHRSKSSSGVTRSPSNIGAFPLHMTEGSTDTSYGQTNTSGATDTADSTSASSWTRQWDEQHNAEYWFNSQTGESSWSNPNVASAY
jgi:hypothetical protein